MTEIFNIKIIHKENLESYLNFLSVYNFSKSKYCEFRKIYQQKFFLNLLIHQIQLKFVLDKFSPEELEIIENIKKKIIINFELLINKEFSSFKNNF